MEDLTLGNPGETVTHFPELTSACSFFSFFFFFLLTEVEDHTQLVPVQSAALLWQEGNLL